MESKIPFKPQVRPLGW